MARGGILLWGARSQARIVAALLARAGRPPSHIFDATLPAPGFPTDATFSNSAEGLRRALDAASAFVVCIGGAHGAQRAALSRALADRFGLEPLSVISPDAVVDRDAVLGAGVQVMAGACIGLGAEIGDFCLVNTNATVDHECRLGAGVHVMGSAALAGRIAVDEHASIGTNATVLPDLKIGARAYVGAGAVVTRDVAPGTVVAGVPARPIRAHAPEVDLSLLDRLTP